MKGRCLVTGAAGFVGSSIVDRLLVDGYEVIGVDCFLDYYPRSIKENNLQHAKSHANFKFFDINILDPEFEQVVEGVDVVFHQAAQAGVRASWGSYFTTYANNNITASQRLLELARVSPNMQGLKKIVYASSSSIYGSAEKLPTSELVTPSPVSPYGVTKLAAEHLMVLYSKEFGVPTTSLRYFTVYGPRQRPDMAFHIFSKAILKGEPIYINGDGEQSRDFTFIDDIVQANISAGLSSGSGDVYNIGGGDRVTVNQVISMLEDIAGKKLEVIYRERQKGDAAHTGSDCKLAEKNLGYKPKVSLREGLERELRWMDSMLKEGIV